MHTIGEIIMGSDYMDKVKQGNYGFNILRCFQCGDSIKRDEIGCFGIEDDIYFCKRHSCTDGFGEECSCGRKVPLDMTMGGFCNIGDCSEN